MRLLTIGAFARASRLSPKALRLYDELGLLPPAHVDAATGYRFYAPEQLERARLVAWLRRVGMPLARIQHVCGLTDAGAAAQEVRAFWARVEDDHAARRDLVSFLVAHLSRKDSAMPEKTRPTDPTDPTDSTSSTGSPLGIRYAALSDTGLVRESNQDTAYAGARLLAVADGFGTAGAPASAAAVDVFKRLEADGVPAGELLNVLEDTVEQAGRAVHEATGRPEADDAGRAEAGHDEAGTTLTAMFWTGSQLALVHIGDTRAHLLRDGELFQITHDHTLVRTMVDEGRLSEAEADSHPQRSLLMRALTGTSATGKTAGKGAAGRAPAADLRLHDAAPGTAICCAPTACPPSCQTTTCGACCVRPRGPRAPYARWWPPPTARAAPTT